MELHEAQQMIGMKVRIDPRSNRGSERVQHFNTGTLLEIKGSRALIGAIPGHKKAEWIELEHIRNWKSGNNGFEPVAAGQIAAAAGVLAAVDEFERVSEAVPVPSQPAREPEQPEGECAKLVLDRLGVVVPEDKARDLIESLSGKPKLQEEVEEIEDLGTLRSLFDRTKSDKAEAEQMVKDADAQMVRIKTQVQRVLSWAQETLLSEMGVETPVGTAKLSIADALRRALVQGTEYRYVDAAMAVVRKFPNTYSVSEVQRRINSLTHSDPTVFRKTTRAHFRFGGINANG